MLEVLTKSIPKATNEIVFALGMIGLIFGLYKYKKYPYIRIVIWTTFVMIIWRAVFRINSSRYAAVLIFPFTFFAAFFLSSLLRNKRRISFLLVVLIGTGTVFNWIYKSYNISEANMYLETLAELHERLNNQKDKYKLTILSDDYYRIKQKEKTENAIESYYKKASISNLSSYIENYRLVDQKTLYCITVDAKENNTINSKSQLSRNKLLLSFFAQKNKKKKNLVYKIETENTSFLTLSQNKIIEPESGLLNNGDLELLDTPEQSYKKLKAHIENYYLYFDFDKSKQTPLNAYFYNDSIYTRYLPDYNCLNPKSLSGANSAKIISPNAPGYLLFNQHFHSGSYEYSLIFSGKKDTKICILYDLYANNKWNVNSLGSCIIPCKGTFQIKTSFSVSGLKPGEFFLVGAWVYGEAYLDNFCLHLTSN